MVNYLPLETIYIQTCICTLRPKTNDTRGCQQRFSYKFPTETLEDNALGVETNVTTSLIDEMIHL